jgi:hypothetical protein
MSDHVEMDSPAGLYVEGLGSAYTSGKSAFDPETLCGTSSES